MYHHRLTTIRDSWNLHRGDLVAAFRKFQDEGRIEIITPPRRTGCCRCWQTIRRPSAPKS